MVISHMGILLTLFSFWSDKSLITPHVGEGVRDKHSNKLLDEGWSGTISMKILVLFIKIRNVYNMGVGDGQGGLACCDSWGRKESDMTERLIWSDLIWYIIWPRNSTSRINPEFDANLTAVLASWSSQLDFNMTPETESSPC